MSADGKNPEIVRYDRRRWRSGLGMDVIAEGLETANQVHAARGDRQCTYGQGYYFSRPVPADAAGNLLTAAPPWAGPVAVPNPPGKPLTSTV